jgi:hypothetical protein
MLNTGRLFLGFGVGLISYVVINFLSPFHLDKISSPLLEC